ETRQRTFERAPVLFAARHAVAMLAEALADDGGKGIAPRHRHNTGHRVIFVAAWETLFPACMKDEQQQCAGDSKVDRAGRGSLFRVHRAEYTVAQENVVEDDEGG